MLEVPDQGRQITKLDKEDLIVLGTVSWYTELNDLARTQENDANTLIMVIKMIKLTKKIRLAIEDSENGDRA